MVQQQQFCSVVYSYLPFCSLVAVAAISYHSQKVASEVVCRLADRQAWFRLSIYLYLRTALSVGVEGQLQEKGSIIISLEKEGCNLFRTFADFTRLDHEKVLSDGHGIFFCSEKLGNLSRFWRVY